jgi:hypothetical protein
MAFDGRLISNVGVLAAIIESGSFSAQPNRSAWRPGCEPGDIAAGGTYRRTVAGAQYAVSSLPANWSNSYLIGNAGAFLSTRCICRAIFLRPCVHRFCGYVVA